MAFIRQYRASDEKACINIFRETAHQPLRSHPDPAVLHIGSFLWCRPYIALYPEWCFVLDDGNDNAVGYILCAPDTPAFVDRFRSEILSVLADHGITKPDDSDSASDLATEFRRDVYRPENMMQAEYPELVKQYPAHLHVDILPSHQSQGWGKQMIGTLLEKLRAEGIAGVHLGMVAENDAAHRFYDRLGIERFDGMHDKGDVGRKGGAVYRVKRTA